MYAIILSGYIPSQKVKEFKQHMRQMSGKPSNQIFDMEVYQDILFEDFYKAKMTFNDMNELFLFMKSDHFSSISGSFKALGVLKDQHIESFSELKKNEDQE